jgi:hypothetical protein
VNKRNGIPPSILLQTTVWKRWELYSESQKEIILEEFRRKLPEDHFNKELLVEFLKEKYNRQELHREE